MTTKNRANKASLEDQIAQAGGYENHKDAVAHLGNHCNCPWSMQAGCRYSDATGSSDMTNLSKCTKPHTETCTYRVYRDPMAIAAAIRKEALEKVIAPGTVCYFIQETVRDASDNYIPCIAVEGEQGYHLTDWAWGKDRAIAQRCADEKNHDLDVDQFTAFRIVAHTMRTVGQRTR
jgi:hypothetical protein